MPSNVTLIDLRLCDIKTTWPAKDCCFQCSVTGIGWGNTSSSFGIWKVIAWPFENFSCDKAHESNLRVVPERKPIHLASNIRLIHFVEPRRNHGDATGCDDRLF